MRACPDYEKAVKTLSAAVPANTLWCLRCGNSSHATAKCETKDPPVHFPPDDGVQRGCLHCGIFGHSMSECLRRLPQVQSEQDAKIATISADHESQATAIQQLQQDVKALQTSHRVIEDCKKDLATLNTKVNVLMSFKTAAEPQLQQAETTRSTFQEFLDKEWKPHKKQFQDLIDAEWSPVKQHFDSILQRDLDRPSDTSPLALVHNVDSSPELAFGDDDKDEDMPTARTTGKRSRTDREAPPTTPAKKRPSSRSSTRRWWVDLEPLAADDTTSAWHTELLDALLAEWTDTQMSRLQQWVTVHSTEEMKTTLDSLSTANTTRRALHAGLRTLLRGARVPPLIFSAHAPKGPARASASSSSLNSLRTTRH